MTTTPSPCHRSISVILALCSLLLLVLAAGCVQTTTTAPVYTEDLPPEMVAVLNESAAALERGLNDAEAELLVVADRIGQASDDPDACREILRQYYRTQYWVAGVAYYQTASGMVQSVPLAVDDLLHAALTSVAKGPGIKAVSQLPVYDDSESGYLKTLAAPVYARDGTRLGVVAVTCAPYYLISSAVGDVAGMDTYNLWVGTPEEFDARWKAPTENTGITRGWTTISAFGGELRVCLVRGAALPLTTLTDTNSTALNAAVIDLYSYATTHEKSEVLAHIARSDPENMILFAGDTSGNILADSSGQSIDQNILSDHDAYGVRIITSMVMRSRQGGGYVHEMLVPSRNVLLASSALPTVMYLLPVDSSWFVGAHVATISAEQKVDHTIGPAVTAMSRSVAGYVWEHGRDATIAEIARGKDSVFLHGVSTPANIVAATVSDGTILVDAQNPHRTGTSLFGMVDSHGSSIGRGMISFAKNGGSLFYFCEKRAGVTDLYLLSITPVNEEWFVLSGLLIFSCQPAV